MSNKEAAAIQDKVKIIKAYLSQELSQRDAARRLSVAESTIGIWASKYKADGLEAFLRPKRNRIYSDQLKLEAVTSYLTGEGSLLSVSEKYHIRDKSRLRVWVKMYNEHGSFGSVKHSGGGSYMTKARKSTTQEERIAIARECLEAGKNYGRIALKYGASYQQVRTWTLRYEELGAAGLEDRRGKRKKDQVPRTELEKAQIEIAQLKHKLYLAEMESYVLKKLEEIERRERLGR
jgi:transposase